jgi:uncharacterized protein YdhG (YjbR/CyaY superfamily)
MARTDFESVNEYIAAQPRPVQAILRRVRAAIRKAVPNAEEVISYQIPGYRLNDRMLIYFAGWKEHFSLYPASDALVAAFKDELGKYKRSKGTIRFPLDEPVPSRKTRACSQPSWTTTTATANSPSGCPLVPAFRTL